MELFKSNFINAYNDLLNNLKTEYNKLRKERPLRIKEQELVKNNLKEIDSIIEAKIYQKISTAFNLIYKTEKHRKKQSVIDKQKKEEEKTVKKSKRIELFNNIHTYVVGISVGVAMLALIIFSIIMIFDGIIDLLKSLFD